MKAKVPDRPFTTADFSPKGGGIDFLGLRWVNLTIVGRDLVPELNNVTNDMGTFFLGAWIPWKFQHLCSDHEDYTEKNYRLFREKVEVALSLTMRRDFDIRRPHGETRNRVGVTQKCELPQKLDFKSAHRGEQNTLFAAAIYGPSLHAVGLVESYYSRAKEGKRPLKIALAARDPDALVILEGVDAALRESRTYSKLGTLDNQLFDENDIRKLAEAGLDPAYYRGRSSTPLKRAFKRKLLPTDASSPGYPRTLTARLILTTLRQREGLTTWDMRIAWFTGMFTDGKRMQVPKGELAMHVRRWACFVARQYQRYAIELFLWCFEDAIRNGCRSIDETVEYWMGRTKRAGVALGRTFTEVAHEVAGPMLRGDEMETSRVWNERVHGGHDRFEDVSDPQTDAGAALGLRMMAGWYWRMLVREQDQEIKHLLTLGGADRLGMSWFLSWLKARKALPVRELLKEIFSGLIFAQHTRVALARFDGSAQRLRFLIGDAGIEPAISARRDLGKLRLPWMPDRLDTLVFLLCDCDVLKANEDAIDLGKDWADV